MAGFWTPALFSLCTAMAGAGSNAPPAAELPAYFPAGLANASGSVGCVRTLAGGVEALDLSSGRRLWKSEPPSRALFIGAESAILLEERGGHLQLAAYEPRQGRRLKTWPCEVGLPAWASLAEPTDGRTWTTFDARARRSARVLEVAYDACQHVASGIAPPSSGPEAKGVIRLELSTGRVEHHPNETLPPPPLVEPVPAGKLQPLRVHVRTPGPDLMLGGPPPDQQGALVAEDFRVVFEKAPDGKGVLVRRWRASTGVEEPPFTIATVADVIWPTLDRGHVAFRRTYRQSTVDLFTLASGKRVATLVRPLDISVIGGRILWTTYSQRDQIVLSASEAVSGRTLWRRTVWKEPPRGEPIP